MKLKLILLAICFSLTNSMIGQSEMNNTDVLKLHEAGLSKESIILKINNSACSFDDSVEAMILLKSENLPESIIQLMIKKANMSVDVLEVKAIEPLLEEVTESEDLNDRLEHVPVNSNSPKELDSEEVNDSGQTPIDDGLIRTLNIRTPNFQDLDPIEPSKEVISFPKNDPTPESTEEEKLPMESSKEDNDVDIHYEERSKSARKEKKNGKKAVEEKSTKRSEGNGKLIVNLGINQSRVGAEGLATEFKLGGQGSVGAMIRSNSKFALFVGGEFLSRGSRADLVPRFSDIANIKRDLQYFNVPFSLGIVSNSFEESFVYIGVGGYASVLIKATDRYYSGSGELKTKEITTQRYPQEDFGALVDAKWIHKKLYLGMRFDYGLKGVVNNVYASSKLANQSILINFGLAI